jgi:redox-sensitive bicupin YhaK (pirin superfamily)
MKKTVYQAETRGKADHGWLKSAFSFSFAGYYDPSRVHFGLLRVLNDDTIAPGTGFGMHPHDNMEIVSIVLQGELLHGDNSGNSTGLRKGEVQIMSAGTGIVHSEHASNEGEVHLLQIWIFPKEKNIKPRYDQKVFDEKEKDGRFQTLVSPEQSAGTLWINQDAWLSIGNFNEDATVSYNIQKAGNGLFAFVIEGGMIISEENLGKRDAIGISETEAVEMQIKAGSEILLIEVPMN